MTHTTETIYLPGDEITEEIESRVGRKNLIELSGVYECVRFGKTCQIKDVYRKMTVHNGTLVFRHLGEYRNIRVQRFTWDNTSFLTFHAEINRG